MEISNTDALPLLNGTNCAYVCSQPPKAQDSSTLNNHLLHLSLFATGSYLTPVPSELSWAKNVM